MLKVLAMIGFSLWAASCFADDANAKGLDELGEAPAAQGEAATSESGEGGEGAAATAEDGSATTTTTPPRAVTEKMYLSTSLGFVSPTRSEGDWRGAGMSDVTFGYRLPLTLGAGAIYGTYRYAPVAIAGEVDDNSYRGVWDMHYFGGLASFPLSGFDLVGTFEIGYVLVYLDSVDGIGLESKHEENGVSVALGGGADWELLGEPGFKFGPRLHAGFGGFTTYQLGAAATFMF